MTPTEQRLLSTLELTVNRKGHLPNCAHGQWNGGWSFDTRHECDIEGCRRTGQPCTRACAAVRLALRQPLDGPILADQERTTA